MKASRMFGFGRKEVLEVVRDPITVFISLVMPLVMLFLFGFALSFDVKDAPLLIVDHDKSVASRALSDQFLNTPYFHLAGTAESDRTAEQALTEGRVRAVLAIPPGFGRRLGRGDDAPVEFLVDGTYASTAAIVAAYGRAIIYAFPKGALTLAVRPELRIWYNPELRSRNFIVPGLFAVILMAFAPLLTALAVARERESGTITQIYASPLTRLEFILGKLIPYAAIASLQLGIVLAAGFLWFKIPMNGNVGLLVALGLIFVVCTVSIGLLVSTLVRTQVAAMLVTLLVTLMPAFLFSGFVYPVFTMPRMFQLYSASSPTVYFIDISRGIVMRGAGPAELWPDVIVLVVYTVLVLGAAVWLVKKRIA